MWAHVGAVAVGGAVGAVARYLVARVAAASLGPAFPYGTLTVNLVGSLILGLLAGFAIGRVTVPAPIRLLVGVGFCGSFTTFSTFAVETLTQQSLRLAIVNLVVNNAASIGAAAIGLSVGMRA